MLLLPLLLLLLLLLLLSLLHIPVNLLLIVSRRRLRAVERQRISKQWPLASDQLTARIQEFDRYLGRICWRPSDRIQFQWSINYREVAWKRIRWRLVNVIGGAWLGVDMLRWSERALPICGYTASHRRRFWNGMVSETWPRMRWRGTWVLLYYLFI